MFEDEFRRVKTLLQTQTFSSQLSGLEYAGNLIKESEDARSAFAQFGLADLLVPLLGSKSVQVPHRTLLTVSYLAADVDGRQSLLGLNILPLLEENLNSANQNMIYTTVTAIYNLTLSAQAAVYYMEGKSLGRLIELCNHEDMEIGDYASGAIFNCTMHIPFALSLITGELWASILGLVHSKNPEVRQQIIRLILKSLTREEIRNTVSHSLLLSSILETLVDDRPAVQVIVIKSILVLVSLETFRIHFATMGGLKRVIDRMGNSPESVQKIGALLLVNLAVDAKVRYVIKDLGGINLLYSFLLSADAEVQRNALWALSNLSQDESNCRAMCDGGIAALLIKQIKSFAQLSKKLAKTLSLPQSVDFEICIDSLKTLGNLAADASAADFILDKGGLDLLSQCMQISAYTLNDNYMDIIEMCGLCFSNLNMHDFARKEFLDIVDSVLSVSYYCCREYLPRIGHLLRAMRNASIEEMNCEMLVTRNVLPLLQHVLKAQGTEFDDMKTQADVTLKNLRRFWKFAHPVDSSKLLTHEQIDNEILMKSLIFETEIMAKINEKPKSRQKPKASDTAPADAVVDSMKQLENLLLTSSTQVRAESSSAPSQPGEFDDFLSAYLGSSPAPTADKRKSVRFDIGAVPKSSMDQLVEEAYHLIESRTVASNPQASKRASVSVSSRLSVKATDSTPLHVQIQLMRDTLKKVEEPVKKDASKRKSTYVNIAAMGKFAAALARRRSRMKEHSSDEESEDDDW